MDPQAPFWDAVHQNPADAAGPEVTGSAWDFKPPSFPQLGSPSSVQDGHDLFRLPSISSDLADLGDPLNYMTDFPEPSTAHKRDNPAVQATQRLGVSDESLNISRDQVQPPNHVQQGHASASCLQDDPLLLDSSWLMPAQDLQGLGPTERGHHMARAIMTAGPCPEQHTQQLHRAGSLQGAHDASCAAALQRRTRVLPGIPRLESVPSPSWSHPAPCSCPLTATPGGYDKSSLGGLTSDDAGSLTGQPLSSPLQSVSFSGSLPSDLTAAAQPLQQPHRSQEIFAFCGLNPPALVAMDLGMRPQLDRLQYLQLAGMSHLRPQCSAPAESPCAPVSNDSAAAQLRTCRKRIHSNVDNGADSDDSRGNSNRPDSLLKQDCAHATASGSGGLQSKQFGADPRVCRNREHLLLDLGTEILLVAVPMTI